MHISEVSNESIRDAFLNIQELGYAVVNLKNNSVVRKGPEIFEKMNESYDSGKRGHYYNEISFNWHEEWVEAGGIGCYHDPSTAEKIFDVEKAKGIYDSIFGHEITEELFSFITSVKDYCIANHPDPYDRKLKVGRVFLRQMGDNESTNHHAFEWHEDIGYGDRPFLQYISAAITLFGKPTLAEKINPDVGDLLIFNNYHRRIDRGLPEKFAFKHRGPKSGPKLFLFIEFLIPKINN